MTSRRARRLVALPASAALVAALAVGLSLRPREQTIAAYGTSLEGRSPAQRANALRAAEAIDGTVLAPGQSFSFNRVVGPLSVDRGYLKAAVSYDGELIPNFGGGVCQASTTLYNAALLAGLQVTERHRHFWPPRYAARGGDAAVAYPRYDLAFRNTLAQPLRLRASRQGSHLVFAVRAGRRPAEQWQIQHRVHGVAPPARVQRASPRLRPGQQRLQVRGQAGFAVTTYRLTTSNGEVTRREIITEDSYPPLNEVRRYGTLAGDTAP